MNFYDAPLEWPEDEEDAGLLPREAELLGDERAPLMEEQAKAPSLTL